MTATSILQSERPLAFRGARAIFIETILIAATVVTPLAAHALGWPVFRILPMFWGVLFAGVVFGWPAGLIAGLLSPVLNHLLTGMPASQMLIPMTAELAIYGALPALLAAKLFRGNLYPAMAIGLLVGRATLTALFVLLVGGTQALPNFLSASVLPGVPMQLAQVAVVPFVGALIIRALRR